MTTGPDSSSDWDIVVVGGGNAALCAALSAREHGATVLLLERASAEERGGNSRFTAGAMRTSFRGLSDILELIPDLSDQEREEFDFGVYSSDEFFSDMLDVTDYRTDPELAELLANESFDTLKWMRSKGVRFVANGRQAFRANGKLRFWGGLVIDTHGGGPGLVDALYEAAQSAGVEVRYGARAVELRVDERGVCGVRVRTGRRLQDIRSKAVVLACGGFEANAEMRARYLGPGWDLVKVRGTRFNTGDGITMALNVDAMPWGHWSGSHAVFWDQNAPAFGDLSMGDGFSKLSYPIGIMINAKGERFIDEGADFRNYTYAKYGRVVMEQPGSFAWQVYDNKVLKLLRDEYRLRQVTRVRADSIEELAAKLEGVDQDQFLATVRSFNESVDTSIPFDPSVKDSRRTHGIVPAKSNWANTIDEPPFEAFAVTCGITFTFGGLRISAEGAQVVDTEGLAIPGLYAAGELVGGLFYGNYPGGSGLTSGAVFGRLAGRSAAEAALV